MYFRLLVVVLLALGLSAASDLDTIFIRLYNGDSFDKYIDKYLNKSSELPQYMNLEEKTAFYIPGYTESADRKSVQTVVEGYLYRKKENILVVDYREIAAKFYPIAAKRAPAVGRAIAKALNLMVQAGVPQESIHVIGHSLGSQVASYVGRQSSFKIKRITGLDPAGPLYNINSHLSASDAEFVDVIHTDFGGFGTFRVSGTVDFFPNGGHRVQPGCQNTLQFFTDIDFCSHHRSWQFYADSLYHPKSYLALSCPSMFEFWLNKCSNNTIVPMGVDTPDTAKGKYYLRTADKEPYGLGLEGTRHETD